jgi:hypothetical protein
VESLPDPLCNWRFALMYLGRMPLAQNLLMVLSDSSFVFHFCALLDALKEIMNSLRLADYQKSSFLS